MPKYRLLTTEELKEMEPDFIKYLVVNGITADDWQKMKSEKKVEAEKIVDLFSDVVFEKILRNAKFVKQQTKFTLKCIKCNEQEMILYALNTTTENNFEDADFFKGIKKYNKNRQVEIFEMLQNGFEITDSREFERLKNLTK